MRNKLQQMMDFIQEVNKVTKENPGLKRKDILKTAAINIQIRKEKEYENNGPKLDDLIGQNNPDPTY